MRVFLEPRRFSALVCAIAGLFLVSCAGTDPGTVPGAEPAAEQSAKAHDDVHGTHWGYETDNGPDNWGSMDPAWSLCAEGREQSPIDLANATEGGLPEVEIHTQGEKGSFGALDNGHTIQINAKTGETLAAGDKTYALVQFHFHAPSEHTVDGDHYPMEMHFVHQAEDGALAVVGVLIEEGDENPGIAPLWARLPEAPDTETTVQIPPGFAEHVFPGDATGVFHYRGSLTTPPCSEGVSWYVRRAPAQLSKDQIETFTSIYDHNNRPVRALNDRTLYLDENPMVIVH